MGWDQCRVKDSNSDPQYCSLGNSAFNSRFDWLIVVCQQYLLSVWEKVEDPDAKASKYSYLLHFSTQNSFIYFVESLREIQEDGINIETFFQAPEHLVIMVEELAEAASLYSEPMLIVFQS